MPYVDTHCHIDLYKNPESLTSQIESNGIYTIAVTNAPSVFFYTKNLAANSKFIRAALGLHPELAAQRSRELPKFMELLNETNYIGEIGLDNLKKTKDDFKIQKEVFEKIIYGCANTKPKILTVHSRRAESEVIEIIGDNHPCKIILHWYTGSLRNLHKAINYGFYFSINCNMLNSKNGQKLIDEIPIERILSESDGPFTKIGQEPNAPTFMHETIKKLSILKNVPQLLLEKQIFENFKTVLDYVANTKTVYK